MSSYVPNRGDLDRSISEPKLEHYIQAVELSSRGTILFFGRLHHES